MANRSPSLVSCGVAIGRATMSVGFLLVAFAGYQLWGTGLSEARAQDHLAGELAAVLAGRADSPPELAWVGQEPGFRFVEPADAALVGNRSAGVPPDSAIPPDPAIQPVAVTSQLPLEPLQPLELGMPFANLRIPSIGLDKTVVEGTTREALRSGPGHYRGTARPGQQGNVAIAGHRTTYGAPFRDLDELAPGDPIIIETAEGTFIYRVEAQIAEEGTTSGHRIVTPEQVEVIADQGDHRLTLTACHPLYSARQRIIVTAVLEDEPAIEPPAEPLDALLAGPVPAPLAAPASLPSATRGATPAFELPAGPRTTTPTFDDARSGDPVPATTRQHPAELAADLDDDLGWQPAHARSTALWAALTTLVVAAAWILGRLWRRVPAYLMAGPSFALCLLTCFAHLDRLIPAA